MAKVSEDYNLAVLYPKVAKQWHPTKNGGLTPEKVAPRSNKRAWWVCDKNSEHVWDVGVAARTRQYKRQKGTDQIGTGCPYCSKGGARKRVSDSYASRLNDGNSLAALYPELTKYWHPTKNGDLKPSDVFPFSTTKVVWKCPKGEDHEYIRKPNVIVTNHKKTDGKAMGCPFCAGKLPSLTNRLDILYPKVAAQWHPTKNGNLKPSEVTGNSYRRIWWKCDKGSDHEWPQSPNARSGYKGRGCPFCAGKAPSVTNCISTKHPELAKYWHPTKNGNETPENNVPGSHKKAWWLCESCNVTYKSEIYQTTSTSRTTCAKCSTKMSADSRTIPASGKSLAELYPLIAKHWHSTKNGEKNPNQIYPNSSRKYWWKCPVGDEHEWDAVASSIIRSNRESGTYGCPWCASKKVTFLHRLDTAFPEIAKWWHPTKNGDELPADYGYSSKQNVWWICPDCGGDWYAMITNLTGGNSQRCRDCGYKVGAAKHAIPELGNTLAEKRPDLVEQWHPTMNDDLTPEDVTPRSSQRVWWKCPVADDHEWDGVIAARRGCPFCSNTMTSVTNRLDLIYPDIAEEWHPTMNGELTPSDLRWGSTQKVWWKCVIGHEWEAAVIQRTYAGTDCPSCTISQVSKRELFLGHELSNFFDVGFGPVNPVKIGSKKWDVDFVIKELKLIIEYDGAYHHHEKFDLDQRKTESLQSGGWTVFRIREADKRMELPPVTPDDLSIPYFKSSKVLANEVLQQIEKVCNVSIPGLLKYLKLDRPVNIRAAREQIASLVRDAEQTTLDID